MLENADITVFNKWYNEETRLDEWHKTQIENVEWFGKQAVTVSDNGLLTANRYIIRIPVYSMPDGKTFIAPEKYKAQKSGFLTGFWTLQSGDIVARGLIDTDNTEDIAGEHFTVTGWADNRRGSPLIQHLRIDGK